jgi:hypothetical protein
VSLVGGDTNPNPGAPRRNPKRSRSTVAFEVWNLEFRDCLCAAADRYSDFEFCGKEILWKKKSWCMDAVVEICAGFEEFCDFAFGNFTRPLQGSGQC